MTGAKAWRQKGTGRARVGALSVPARRGGGAAFGPKPRGYTSKVNRKARRKALRAALSVHADRDSVAVLDADAYSEPSTKKAAEALAKWGARTPDAARRSAPKRQTSKRAFATSRRVTVLPAAAVGVADVIGHRSLVLTQAALEVLETRCGEVTRAGSGSDAAEADGSDS